MPKPLKTSAVIHVNRLTDFDAKNVGKYTIPYPWIIWVGSPEAMNLNLQCSNGEGSNNPPHSWANAPLREVTHVRHHWWLVYGPACCDRTYSNNLSPNNFQKLPFLGEKSHPSVV